MLDVVVDVRRLSRDEWWSSVREALDDLTPADVGEYEVESERLGAASADGLDDI